MDLELAPWSSFTPERRTLFPHEFHGIDRACPGTIIIEVDLEV
jgi:hypothetical protein